MWRAADVLAWLVRAIKEHGAPAFLRSDNGPEFIAQEVQRWLAEKQIKTIYIEPGSPWQNGFVESFHERLRDECLNQEVLWTRIEARVVIADLPPASQPLSPVRQARLPQPGALRGTELTLSFLRGSWTTLPNPTTSKPAHRLTLQVARKGGSRQGVLAGVL